MRPSRLVALGVVALLASSAPARSATGGTDVGATAPLPSLALQCGTATLYFQGGTVETPPYSTPDGVITSWSTMARAVVPGSASLKIGREGPIDTFTITGTTPNQQLVAGRLNSFLVRVPVRVDDRIGLYLPPQPTQPGCDFSTGQLGDAVKYAVLGNTADLGVGATYTADTADGFRRLNLSVRVEPDADGDGYGDLTQDACPSLTNSHDDCTPPDTFLKRGPAKKVRSKAARTRITITFFASEPSSTFACTVDGRAAKPCAGKLKTKVGPGRHRVTVTATDAVGNVDPSPLRVAFTVVHRPR